MAKMTNLEVVQSTLLSMDSDDVNAVDGTEESLQVLTILRETYFELMSQGDWPHLEQTCTLLSVGDSESPTSLRVPDSVDTIGTIRYELPATAQAERAYPVVVFKSPQDFMDNSYSLKLSDTSVIEVDINGVKVFVRNDRHPTFWTSFDDETVIFDAYDNTIESTVQGNKTSLICRVIPTFEDTNTFIPDMPAKMFPLYLAEVKRASHLYLKQQDSKIDAKRALRGFNKMRHDSWRTNDGKQRPRFGRSGR